jgi:SpoIID/LytB domain protein
LPRRTTLLAALVTVAALVFPAVPAGAARAEDAPPAGDTLATQAPPTAQAMATGRSVELVGHGWGHGRGLGQYGAYGYAADAGWASPRILDHFYGATVAGSVGNPVLTVRMVERDGQSTVVALNRGRMTMLDSAGRASAATDRALRIDLTSAGTWQVYDGPGCGGPWTARSGTIASPLVRVIPEVPDPKQQSPDDALQMCLNSSDARYVRGNILATQSGGAHYTVNELTMDSYLKGVVPRESPASWPAPALEAQSVAARSYAYAENRYSFAKTCNTTSCQVYGGWQLRSGGTVSALEDGRSSQAVAATSGLVRMRSGSVMRTEFSASTGGYTAGGLFPAVPDDGDGRSPYHTWTTSVPASSIEAIYRKGTLVGAAVVQRNGLGQDGGRVVNIRLDFSGGSVTVSGESFRSALGLRSDWYSVTNVGSNGGSPPPPPPPPSGAAPVGGYVLSASGTLTAFGRIHAPWNATPVPGNLARAVAVGGPTSSAGYVLSGRGTLVPFNKAPAVDAVDFGFDVAKDLVLRRDGRSGWVLEGYGGLHEFGGAPPIRVTDGQYKAGDGDWARRMVLRNDQASGYIAYRDGIVMPFGGAPLVRWTPMPVARRTTDLVLGADGVSGFVVDDHGNRYPFGPGTPPPTTSGSASGVMASAGRPDGSGYLVTSTGSVIAVGAPGVASPAAPGPVVDLAAVPQISGYVLDGFGGLHPFGGAPPAVGATYRSGHDWARRAIVRPDGAGYVLDANGRLLPFGTTSAPVPPVPATATWPGWDIARDAALIPGSNAGYVLDGWGGLHPFNGAPKVTESGYWPGWDIARRLVMDPGGRGGYVLDGYGALHPFTIAGRPSPPAPAATAYTPKQDQFRDVVLTGSGRGYTVDVRGGLHPFGYGGAFAPPWPSGVGVAGMATDNPARGSAIAADCQGGLHVAPDWEGAQSARDTWPGWCIARDVAARPAG